MPFNPDDFDMDEPPSRGFNHTDFDEPKQTPTWGATALDVAKQIPTAAVTGLESLATSPAKLMGLAGRGIEALGFQGDPERAAEQAKIRELAQAQGGTKGIGQYLPEAQTPEGQYTRAGIEGAVAGAAQPGRLAVGLGAGVAGGLASHGAGEATAGTPLEIPARIGAGVLGAGSVAGIAGAGRALSGAEASAGARLGNAFARDKDTPEAALQRLQQLREIRPEATLADAGGENVRGLLEGIAQTPGAGRANVIQRLTAQQQAQMERIVGDLASATGTRQSAFRAIEDTMASRQRAATPLYERAYSDGDREIWSPDLERLSGAPFVQSAMRKAVSTWRNQAIADGYGAMKPTQVERGGILNFGQSVFPNIQFWDYTKRMLDDQTSAAVRAGQNQKARVLTTLTQQLRDSLDRHVPSYSQARNAWAGPSRYMDAIEEGKSILNKNITAEELRAQIGNMSEGEREGYRIGAVSSIRNKMGSDPAKMADMTKYIRSPEMRAKLETLMPPESFQRFNNALDYEIKSHELVRGSLAGSQTARRLAMQDEAESIVGDLALHTFKHGATLGLLGRIYNTLGKPVRDKLRARADQLLSETLLATEPKVPRRAPQQAIPLMGSAAIHSGFKSGGRIIELGPRPTIKQFRAGGRVKRSFNWER